MRRSLLLILTLFAFGALAGTAAAATPKPTLQLLRIHHYGDPSVALSGSGQTVLIAGNGYMVYGFSTDHSGYDSCQKIRQCLSSWPPVLAPHKPVLGRGVKRSLLHSIRLSNGKHQLTYNGWPLYTYTGDTRPRDPEFINLLQFDGFWPAVTAAGKLLPTN